MTSPEHAPADTDGESSLTEEQARSRSKRGSGKRTGKSADNGDSNRPRQRNDRFSMWVFADGIERAFCTEMPSLLPVEFPVNHRTGMAVINPVAVARAHGRILLCDCQHRGNHIWPNGDVVEPDGESAASTQPGREISFS